MGLRARYAVPSTDPVLWPTTRTLENNKICGNFITGVEISRCGAFLAGARSRHRHTPRSRHRHTNVQRGVVCRLRAGGGGAASDHQ
eukprot:1327583-Rhodomonas_salina.6